MPLAIKDLYAKAVSLATNVEDNFLDLGRALRQLLDCDPALFQQVYKASDLGRRKAYYLVEVSRAFDKLQASRARLKGVGWTKLQIIGKHATQDNVDELLSLAEKYSANDLERLMRGEKPLGGAHCVLMYLTSAQYAKLEKALLENGASKSGRGLLNKEEALMRALTHNPDAS